jgi:hypothetical protein
MKKVLNDLNNQLDIISHNFGLHSGELENIKPHKFHLGSQINEEIPTDGQKSPQTKNISDPVQKKNRPEEHQVNIEISARIHELLKKTGKPTPYHELTKHLSQDYPEYDYGFFLKEVEDLQKEGKVEVQLIAGKLYFQIKKT